MNLEDVSTFNVEIEVIFHAMKIVRNKWTVPIIFTIMENKDIRFNELEKSIDSINPKILIKELKNLANENLICRNVYPEIPPRVEYCLTEKGLSLKSGFNELINYGKRFCDDKRSASEGDKYFLYFSMGLITSKWSAPIMYSLFSGTKRFKELERFVTGISTRMLSKELKQLEEKGIIERISYSEVPPRVEYKLTDRGHALYHCFLELISYAKKYPYSV